MFVIIRTQKWLKKLSDITFDFKEIKTGWKVTSFKFYINTNKTKNKAIDEVCVTTDGKSTNEDEKCFTELIDEVKTIFKENVTELESKYILDTAKGDINIIKENYA
jgi:plasmid replication initiation protein